MNKHSMPRASSLVFPPPGNSSKAPPPAHQHFAAPAEQPEPISTIAWAGGTVIGFAIVGGLAYVSNLYVQEIGRVVAFGIKLGLPLS